SQTQVFAWSDQDTEALSKFVKEQRQQAWQLRYKEDSTTSPVAATDRMQALMSQRITAQFNARQIRIWIDKLIKKRELDLGNSDAYNTAIRSLETYLTGGEFKYSPEEEKLAYADWRNTLEPALAALDDATLKQHYKSKKSARWIFFGWLAVDQAHAKEARTLANTLNLNPSATR
ncbi:MAG: hypothetical protein KDD39_11955, partial [Bdellovibrionales bacterium]|nr:hypothetical protein [Bdellovibrionales bacterium]